MIKDHRDLPMLYMLFNVVVTTIPAAAVVFACGSNWLGLAYWICNMALFQERFIIGLHYYSHRGLFKNPTINAIVPLLLSPFFGVPSGMYHLHHCIMHHSENNLKGWDLSSTEPYQRDSVCHFLIYWMRFLFAVWVELPFYAFRRQRYGLALSAATAIVCFWVALLVLYALNPCGTFWVFMVPTVVNSFLMMMGNWSQHIFVDPLKSRSNYHLTYNVVNDECNQRSFNDGYHTEHHLNSRKHWSELPASFAENIKTYAAEDAIVFEKLDPITVGLLVFLQKYDTLAKHLVQFRKPARTTAEVETFLRARLVPICGK